MNFFQALDNGLSLYYQSVFDEHIGDTRENAQTGTQVLQEVKNLVHAYRLPTDVLQKPNREFYPNLRRVIALSINLVERIRNVYQVIEACKRLRDQLSVAVLQRRRHRLAVAHYNSLNHAEQNAFNNNANLTVAQVLADIRGAAPEVDYPEVQSQLDQEYHDTLLLLRKNVTAQMMYVFVKRELETLLHRMRERFTNITSRELQEQHQLSADDTSYLTTQGYIVRDINANQVSRYYERSIDLVRNTQGYVEMVKQRIARLVRTYVNEHYRNETFKPGDYVRIFSINEEIKRNLKLLDRWSVERTNDVNEMFRDLEQHDRYTTKIERIKFELENNRNGGGALAVMNAYKTATRTLSLTQSLQQQRVSLTMVLRNIKHRIYTMNRHFSLLAENHLSVGGTLYSFENMFRRLAELTDEQTAYTFDQFLRQAAAKFFDENGNPLNENGAPIPMNNDNNDQYNQMMRDETQNLDNAFAQIDNVRLRNEEHDTIERAQQQILHMPLIRVAQIDGEDNNDNPANRNDHHNRNGGNGEGGGGGRLARNFIPIVTDTLLARQQKKT